MGRTRWRRMGAWLGRWARRLLVLAALWVGLQLVLWRFLPVPLTPLMVLRLAEGEGMHKRWVPLSELPATVPRAVIAAEDQRFCLHGGVDLVQVRKATERWQEGGRMRGASTLSMQTTKNVFLWPGRNPVRKALELPLTPLVEAVWGKRRVVEIYLNIAEWGPGVYGIEAAARHHFGVSASALDPDQAALLAAILPSPRTRPVTPPSAYTQGRAERIKADIRVVDIRCLSR